jgi:rhodanese-related sulfurtransferase
MTRRLTLALSLLAAVASPARAAEPTLVTAPEVLRLTAGGGGAVVVDTRSPQEWLEARIPGALSIPAELVKPLAARLPKDRKTPIVFYCRGPG